MTTALTAYMRHGIAAIFLPLLFIAGHYSIAGEKTPPSAHKMHKVVFQVSDNDPKKWNLGLINARNVQSELGKDNVMIEIVSYGPAIDMLRIESEVAPLVDEAIKNGIKIVACENTMRGSKISTADMLPDIDYTRAGVAYLIKKQEQGYAYIRP